MKKGEFITVIFIVAASILHTLPAVAQSGKIIGRVYDAINNSPIPFANIYIDSLYSGTTSDLDGNFQISNLNPGVYNIVCSFIGFETQIQYEVTVTSVKPTKLDFGLQTSSTNLNEIKIVANPFNRKEESPLSMKTISASEIYRNPGGNRDISKVIQILPGVSTSLSFRNDIIVRGGAPNENRFFIDGIEVPNINHFATQGSSGGPVGMINVNLIREVDFYTGSFPAGRGNALSSVTELNLMEGNNERISATCMVGSSDIGFTIDGPIGKQSNILLSTRRSYLQFLFKALALPFLPTYNDLNYKQVIRFNPRNTITFIGLAAYDQFELNTSVNNSITDNSIIERNNYILGYLPVNKQWNYTGGVKWRHFFNESYIDIVASRNHLNNKSEKYKDNIVDQEQLLLDYKSEEIENKVRIENTFRAREWKWVSGLGYEYAIYSNATINKIIQNTLDESINFNSKITIHKYYLFTQISRKLIQEKLTFSFGLRTDFNDYSKKMENALKQISPRLSLSYLFAEDWRLNFNLSRYFQLPAYTSLGYRNKNDILVNQKNNIQYIQSDQLALGLEFKPSTYSKITLECFIKDYNSYPFSVKNNISLANLGADFGVIGNEEVLSISKGRSYGIELFAQQKLSSSVYGTFSYTWVRSEFNNAKEKLIPSSWDNRHILNVTMGKKLKKNWEVGIKFRFLGGAPYTPYDIELSKLKSIWDVNRQGILDWERLNEKRNSDAHQLDIRIDKKYFFNNWTLNFYLDIQNIYNATTETQPFLDVVYDANGQAVEDPHDPNSYLLKEIENTSGNILPSIGIMIEF